MVKRIIHRSNGTNIRIFLLKKDNVEHKANAKKRKNQIIEGNRLMNCEAIFNLSGKLVSETRKTMKDIQDKMTNKGVALFFSLSRL